MINFFLLAILIGVTYFVAREGPQGAAFAFIAVLVGGLLAMNVFEPLAKFLSLNFLNSPEWQVRWDVVALLGSFAGFVSLIRLMGDKLFPTYAPVHPFVYEILRWGLGAATGYVTMAIVLTALHVAPLPRTFFGFTPEGNNFLSISAPDRQWLAFTQYVSEKSLRGSASGGSRIFDGIEFPANPDDASSVRVWSSFPIRYAARRETYTTGGRRSSATSPPPPVAAPGTRSGTGGF